jgi:hypothetical protein
MLRALDLTSEGTGMSLEMFQMFDGQFHDFRFLDPPTPLSERRLGKETGQIRQTIVHPIPTSFLNYTM